MTDKFDFNETLKAIQSSQAISGKDGVLAPLLKQLTEAALEAELDSHLADEVIPNRRNAKSSKTLKTSEGKIDLTTPRDRAGTFEPQIIRKNQLPTKVGQFYMSVNTFRVRKQNNLHQNGGTVGGSTGLVILIAWIENT